MTATKIRSTQSRSRIRIWIVSRIYADQSSRRIVKATIASLLDELGNGIGVNVGGGDREVDARLYNVDISDSPSTSVVGDAMALPFRDQSCELCVCQEVLEHLRAPWLATREMARILKDGGAAYFQVPFVLGVHSGPNDYYRFTLDGLEALVVQAGLSVEKIGVSCGSGTGFYRIAVEFCASVVGLGGRPAYLFAKGLAAVLLAPLKLFDLLLNKNSGVPGKIDGGYWVVARKVKMENSD